MILINVIAFLFAEKKMTSPSVENPAPKSRDEMLKCMSLILFFVKVFLCLVFGLYKDWLGLTIFGFSKHGTNIPHAFVDFLKFQLN